LQKNHYIHSVASSARPKGQRERISINRKNIIRLSPIIDIMDREHISIPKLAHALRTTRQSIYILMEQDDCKLSRMEKIAHALGCRFKYFLCKKK